MGKWNSQRKLLLFSGGEIPGFAESRQFHRRFAELSLRCRNVELNDFPAGTVTDVCYRHTENKRVVFTRQGGGGDFKHRIAEPMSKWKIDLVLFFIKRAEIAVAYENIFLILLKICCPDKIFA